MKTERRSWGSLPHTHKLLIIAVTLLILYLLARAAL